MNTYNFKNLFKSISIEFECTKRLLIKTHKKRKAVLNLPSFLAITESEISMGWSKRVEE
jgi:hypothetical protein